MNENHDAVGRFSSGHSFTGSHVEAKFDGHTETTAQEHWVRQLEKQTLADGGLFLSHESPGDMTDTFKKTGVSQGFATVAAPSNFVTSNLKTRVWFKVPYSDAENISPDMRYDPDKPHLDALEQNGGRLRGVDVSFNFDVRPDMIAKIEVIKDGKTMTSYDGRGAWWNVAKQTVAPRRDVRRGARY